MRRAWKLPFVGGLVALACAGPIHARAETSGENAEARAQRTAEVRNTFQGPTGGIRVVDAGSGPKGTFRLALNTEFFVVRDYFVSGDRAHHFAGNLSLTITPTEFLEVFASAEVFSAWSDSNDPMLIQRVADLALGLKGFHRVKPWVTVGGDFSLLFPGGVGDGRATFRATSFGFRGNVTLDFREHVRRESPIITRFNVQYWFDNTANLTGGIEDQRFAALGGLVPSSIETRHLLTSFERFAYGVNRTDAVRLAAGLEVPLRVNEVGLHPMFEWLWDIPVNRQGYICPVTANPNADGCLEEERARAFPMVLAFGLRILTPPKGLAFTIAADVGITGARTFVRELAPTAPYNIILGIGYAFDPKPAPPIARHDARPVYGDVRGRVTEEDTGEPVAGAVVRVAGVEVSPQVTDDAGRFTTYDLPEGEVVLEVSHPDYVAGTCAATVPSETACSLTPSTLDGELRLRTVGRGGKPVSDVTVIVRGPEEHRVKSDGRGLATLSSIAPGAYTAHLEDPAYLIAVIDFEIARREKTTVELRAVAKPSRPKVVIKKGEIGLRRQVTFATGSDEILPSSEPLLHEIADALLRNPEIELVEIQGHTDNRGDPQLNMDLSQRRAESVQRWLVSHGVERERLTAKGYGPTRPIVPNITAYNRARNRRVQFKIVKRAAVTADASR